MQIEVKGRNLPVTDELREYVTRRFDKIAKQVSELAVLEVEVFEERNPANPDCQVAEATLRLKGVTLRAKDASPRPQALDQPRRRRAGAPGQAPPRQAPQRARAARRAGGPAPRPRPPGGQLAGRVRGAPARRGRSSTLRPMTILDRALRMGEGKQFRQYAKRVDRINSWEPELELLDDAELRAQADSLRERARNGESLDELLPETFAVVRETSRRTLGMRHFDVQMIGGMVLHGGAIAEMKTGEGKTLTATLAVALNALAGEGVHLVTVNDYLARRDAEWMGRLYTALGLSVGILQNMQPYEEKRAAYAADITYGTNSEFGFDYLRDNMATSLEEKVQHGGRFNEDGKPLSMHHYAIVDEVDNILIDEARTPLIISGAPEQAADLYGRFAKLAPKLTPGKKPEGMDPKTKKGFVADYDYEFEEKHKTVSVTERGVAKAEKFLGIDHLYRAENGPLVNHLIQALSAESLYKRDVDYAVVDGEVKIIDEFTGRILDGRRWSEGLHQAVEAKEGVRVQEENQTLATITLQNYFRMYDKLAGMTGTALTEATEFMKIYKLPVVQVPTNRPMVRKDENDQVFKTKDGKWRAVVRELEARHDGGPAGARRHDLRRGLRAARRAAQASRGSRTRSSTPSPSTPSARARRSPRPAAPARSRSPRTWPAAASTSSSAATPSTRPSSSSPSSACAPASPTTTSASPTCCRRSRRASRTTARRSSRPAACSSSAPSATSRAASTTSCAAAPAARATRASRASSSPPRTTSCACSPATASTASSTASAPSTSRARRSRSRRRCSRSRSRTPSARSRSRTT